MKTSRQLLLLSIALYALSLSLPTVGRDSPGWLILLIGGFTVLATPANASWFANPVLYAAWFAACIDKRRATMILGGLALAIGAAFMLFKGRVLTDESGIPKPIGHLYAGYWFWLLSMAVACLAPIGDLPRNSDTHRSLSGRKY